MALSENCQGSDRWWLISASFSLGCQLPSQYFLSSANSKMPSNELLYCFCDFGVYGKRISLKFPPVMLCNISQIGGWSTLKHARTIVLFSKKLLEQLLWGNLKNLIIFLYKLSTRIMSPNICFPTSNQARKLSGRPSTSCFSFIRPCYDPLLDCTSINTISLFFLLYIRNVFFCWLNILGPLLVRRDV